MNILNRPVLELNKSWVPIGTKTVRQAITMACGDWLDAKGELQPKAKILNIETWTAHDWDTVSQGIIPWIELPPIPGEPVIRAGGGKQYRCPEIIVASRYNKIPRNQLNLNKKNLIRRDEEKCQYCGIQITLESMTTDHVVPRCKGGISSWENCVASCFGCNQKKRDRTPEEAKMELLKKPMKPGMEIIGHTRIRIRSWEIFFGKI